jgi:hypothetical protein
MNGALRKVDDVEQICQRKVKSEVQMGGVASPYRRLHHDPAKYTYQTFYASEMRHKTGCRIRISRLALQLIK